MICAFHCASLLHLVKTIVEELKATVSSNAKEVDSLYNIELIKLPATIREMRWLDFFGKP